MTHIPVLLNEVIPFLDPKKGETIVDGTAGGGGHAQAILERLSDSGRLVLIDWDETAVAELKKRFHSYANVECLAGNYASLPAILKNLRINRIDGLLLDLGFSSDQLHGRGRGFSFNKEASGEPLLMTYNDESESLSHFFQRVGESELANIIQKFGEERYARQIAKAIMARKARLKTAGDLAETIQKAVPRSYERGRLHPATRTFQALRIYLNNELGNLETLLQSLTGIMNRGGRVVIISFHSLEDRIVKNSFKELSAKGRVRIITKKPIIAADSEVRLNPRARSAKLRAVLTV